MVGRQQGDAVRAIADPSEAELVFNWVDKTSIDEMMKSTLAAYDVR